VFQIHSRYLEIAAVVSTIALVVVLVRGGDALTFALATICLFSLAMLGATHKRQSLELTLERDDAVIGALQPAFDSHNDGLPGATVGAAHASATSHAAIGGDTYDVRRIDDRFGYLLVADVSGKGLAAAADTAMIKYTVAAYAAVMRDPAEIVAGLNREFIRSRTLDGAFVVVFFAIYDSLTGDVHYCAAGPNPAYVRREASVRRLDITGPVVGLDEAMTFEAAHVRLAPGETLLVATDGLTEARDASHKMLDDDGAMGWLRDLDRGEPQALASAIANRLHDYVGGNLTDDLALLTVTVDAAHLLPAYAA
jgi:sigma-B regulation protein RsbU (phosphoserine phosphatase)